MPSKSAIRVDASDAYYHLYLRGANKQPIFGEQDDYDYFLKLLSRYLSKSIEVSKTGETYPNFRKSIQLLAYCLIDNHFHLLVYQNVSGSITKLMRSLLTSYSMYFNLKYKRTGPLFEGRYKSSLIYNQDYLEHISRYIHINPRYWRRYPNSSLGYYLNNDPPEWLQPNKIAKLFKSSREYLSFISDYEGHKLMLKQIKRNLADY
jgi:putative transposase